MIIYCQNYEENEFFKEKRLVFQEKLSPTVRDLADIRAEKSKKREAEKREAEKKREAKYLVELKKAVEVRRKEIETEENEHPNTYINDPYRVYSTRDKPIDIVNPERKREIEKKLHFDKLMMPEEIERMKKTHTLISSHYINPAFMMAMDARKYDKTLSSDDVYKTFQNILKNPYEYEYIKNKDLIEVKHRGNKNKHSITIEGNNKLISEVNGESLKVNGGYPWENINYIPTITTNIKKLENTFKNTEDWNSASDNDKEHYIRDNITIPLRIIELIEARNNSTECSTSAFKALQAKKADFVDINNSPRDEVFDFFHRNNGPLTLPLVEVSNYNNYIILMIKGSFLAIDKEGYMIDTSKNELSKRLIDNNKVLDAGLKKINDKRVMLKKEEIKKEKEEDKL